MLCGILFRRSRHRADSTSDAEARAPKRKARQITTNKTPTATATKRPRTALKSHVTKAAPARQEMKQKQPPSARANPPRTVRATRSSGSNPPGRVDVAENTVANKPVSKKPTTARKKTALTKWKAGMSKKAEKKSVTFAATPSSVKHESPRGRNRRPRLV